MIGLNVKYTKSFCSHKKGHSHTPPAADRWTGTTPIMWPAVKFYKMILSRYTDALNIRNHTVNNSIKSVFVFCYGSVSCKFTLLPVGSFSFMQWSYTSWQLTHSKSIRFFLMLAFGFCSCHSKNEKSSRAQILIGFLFDLLKVNQC